MEKLEEYNILMSEISFSYSRSSGAGGQNVNKVNSKATIRWNVSLTLLLNDHAKKRFLNLFKNTITQDLEVVISSQEHRTQIMNKDACLKRLKNMISNAKTIPKTRIKTRPKKSAILKRLDHKKKNADKKKMRKFNY